MAAELYSVLLRWNPMDSRIAFKGAADEAAASCDEIENFQILLAD
jgi:hypothetical protein